MGDACNVCGGDGTLCIVQESNDTTGNFVEETPTQPPEPAVTSTEAALIGVAVAVPVLIISGALAVVAYLAWKNHQNPYHLVPKSLFDSLTGSLAQNPLYDGASSENTNPL